MKFVSRQAAFLLLLLLFSSTQSTIAQKRKPAQKGSVSIRAQLLAPGQSTSEAFRRHEAFLKAWNTIKENYYDQTFNNLDWDKIKLEYEPRVLASKSDPEFHDLLEAMIQRLGRSHLSVIRPEVYRAIETAKKESRAREVARNERWAELVAQGKEDEAPDEDLNFDDPLSQYGIGVDLRIIDERFVITRINSNSAAEFAGLKTGFVIEKINGVSLNDLLFRVDIYNRKSPNVRRYLPIQIVGWFLNGEKDSVVTLNYLDENDQPKEIKIRRERLKTTTLSLSRTMPELQLVFETKPISEDIGYIRFNYFGVPVIGKFCDAIGEFKGKKAIIIDLRGNMGGVLATLVGLGGMLTDTEIDLGTSVYKQGSERLAAISKAKNFKGKLVFLVDNQTVSAAEVFAAAMQDAKRALVVGERTAGETLPSMGIDLPTGAVMQYPIANYRSSGGKFLEGVGVSPDFSIALSRKGLLEGKDEQLEKALALIKDEKISDKAADPVLPMPKDFSGPVPSSRSVNLAPPKRITGGNGDAAPPPPPLMKQGSGIGGLSAMTPPPPPPKKAEPVGRDASAEKVIADFLATIGGKDPVAKIDSYELRGTTELLIKGTKNEFELEIYRDGGSKYSEIMRSNASGEIREVHNGKTHYVQADYGVTRDIPFFPDVVDKDILAPIRALANADYFVYLKDQGTFDRDGRKVNLLDGRTKNGMIIAMAFDVETKMLVNFTGSYYGISFGDYRKTGAIMLPYRIERERIMNIILDSVKVNSAIDPLNFERKQNCFDIAN
ncbi:MAG TPA: S41 family peptidase [Pyrinomonadaceae bacterium]|nr:S41 family peptidase [Pyrinomonadaceae bacterium]